MIALDDGRVGSSAMLYDHASEASVNQTAPKDEAVQATPQSRRRSPTPRPEAHRLPSKRDGQEVGGQNADGPNKKQRPEQVEQSNFSQSVRSRKSLGMDHDLKERASSAERFNVGAPLQAREKQATHQQEVPADQQRKPENYPHSVT